MQRRSAENHFTFLLILDSVFPAFLVGFLFGAFPLFLAAAGLDTFPSCFFLGDFYKKRKKKEKCWLKCLNEFKVFKSSEKH